MSKIDITRTELVWTGLYARLCCNFGQRRLVA